MIVILFCLFLKKCARYSILYFFFVHRLLIRIHRLNAFLKTHVLNNNKSNNKREQELKIIEEEEETKKKTKHANTRLPTGEEKKNEKFLKFIHFLFVV